MKIKLLGITTNEFIENQIHIVASGAKLSRTKGNVFQIYDSNQNFEKEVKFISKIIAGSGHNSISEHDYMVFALKDVSGIVEEKLIEQRFASFTIKSGRETDFSVDGFFVPDFRLDNGNLHPNNDDLKEVYKNHASNLFSS